MGTRIHFIYVLLGINTKLWLLHSIQLPLTYFRRKEGMRKEGAELQLGNPIKIQDIILKGVNIVLTVSWPEIPLQLQ